MRETDDPTGQQRKAKTLAEKKAAAIAGPINKSLHRTLSRDAMVKLVREMAREKEMRRVDKLEAEEAEEAAIPTISKRHRTLSARGHLRVAREILADEIAREEEEMRRRRRRAGKRVRTPKKAC